jgi:asparagine synthase (glutamine-hydrolysing)
MLDDSISRRGPDAAGRFHDVTDGVEILMLHRRLSIIDHTGGGQPMVSYENDTPELAMVFNGCIYNNAKLRKELSSQGATFISDHSDTETLFKAYEQWGASCTDHIDGMYAVAMWDRRTLQLSLYRDPYGQKPLYFLNFGETGDGCVFCSNPAPLQKIAHELGLDNFTSNEVQRYLQLGYLTGDATLVQPVRRVNHKIVPLQPTNETVEDAIRGSVIDHLESDVPLGCFLSGGVDSSLIAAFAQQELGNLQTYCVKMDDPAYDESSYALEVAKHLGTTHQTLRVSMDPAADLLTLIGQLGQPFADSSILPTYWISKAARKEVTVALSGDGGDELFLGYNRYLAINTISRWHSILARIPWGGGSKPRSVSEKLGRMADAARDWPLCNVASIESIFSRKEIESLTGEPFVDAVTPDMQYSTLRRLQQFDIEHYLPCDLLRKVDTASMAVALEVRSPFLSMRVRNAIAPLTTRELLVGGRKGLLRSIAKKYLPDHIVDRPKMGFAVPLASWLRNEQSSLGKLTSDVLLSSDPFSGLNIDTKIVAKMMHEHRTERRNHEHKLFSLLTLALWSQRDFAS